MKQTETNDLSKLSQIEEILGLNSANKVVAKINAKIKEYIDDFNDMVDDGHFIELRDLCGLENDQMYFDKNLDKYELWRIFKDSQYELYYDEVENFITAVEDYFRSVRNTRRNISDLKDLLKD